MSSPSSSNSSPSHSPLYCSLAEQYRRQEGDPHSVFYASPTTSTASNVTPSTSTGVSSPRAEETAAKVASSAKRKLEEQETTEQPRKKRCKEHHIENPCTSPTKRKRSSSESSESAGEGSSTAPSPKHKKGKNVPLWQWASRYNAVSHRPDKMRLNKLFLKQLHKELLLAQSALQEHDLEVAQLWKEIVPQVPSSREPIVLFKRTVNPATSNPATRLNWKKLAYALSFLGRVEHGSFIPIEKERIQATYIWMHSFLKQLYPNLKTPRILMKPQTFTFLCGQALTAQNVWISPLDPEDPSWRQSHLCFLSNEDVARALEDEQIIEQQSAVCFCQHHDSPRPGRSKGLRLCAQFPIVDFDSDTEGGSQS